jgi:hypothetical protein
LAGAAVLVGCVAITWRYVRRDSPDFQIPDTVALRTPWGCGACGNLMALTPRERVRLERKSAVTIVGGTSDKAEVNEDVGRTSERLLVLGCPRCGKMELRQAYTCTRCHTPFVGVLRGEVRSCPVCQWRPGERANEEP